MRLLVLFLMPCLLPACAQTAVAPDTAAPQHYVDPSAAPPPYHAASLYFVGSAKHAQYPMYPPLMMESGTAGAATIQYRVLEDGRGADFKVVSWDGSPAFAESALAFLKQPDIRFRLATSGPNATGTWTHFHMTFCTAPCANIRQGLK